MNTRRRRLATLVALVVAGAVAHATDTVNVANLTQFNNPVSTAIPGRTIVMANGTWTNVTLNFDGKLAPNNSGGTSTLPITLRAQTPGSVILTGTSKLRIAGNWMVVDGLRFEDGALSGGSTVIEFRNGSSNRANNCRLTNTTIVNYGPDDPNLDYDWVGLYGRNNCIDHCLFDEMKHKGVLMVVWLDAADDPTNHQIDRNYFGDRTSGGGDNGWETIRVGDSSTSVLTVNNVFEYNFFERCNGEIEIISNKSIGNTYRHNVFKDCEGSLTLRHGEACIVEGNWFFGNGLANTGGVRVVGPDHIVRDNYFANLRGTSNRGAIVVQNGVPSSALSGYLQAVNVTIAHNTIVDCEEPLT